MPRIFAWHPSFPRVSQRPPAPPGDIVTQPVGGIGKKATKEVTNGSQHGWVADLPDVAWASLGQPGSVRSA